MQIGVPCIAGGCLEQPGIKTKRIKALKIIGEAVGQLVLEKQTPIRAVKIDRIKAELKRVNDDLFKDKLIKKGVVEKEIFFVDGNGMLRYTTEEIPFTLAVDIPGLDPATSPVIQNHLLDITVDYNLIPPSRRYPGCLEQITVAHILVIAAEWTQLDIVTGINQSFI